MGNSARTTRPPCAPSLSQIQLAIPASPCSVTPRLASRSDGGPKQSRQSECPEYDARKVPVGLSPYCFARSSCSGVDGSAEGHGDSQITFSVVCPLVGRSEERGRGK